MEVPSEVVIHIGRETAAWSLWVYAMWGEEDRGKGELSNSRPGQEWWPSPACK